MDKKKIYVATFSENAVEVIRQNQINIELNQLCISENLDDERISETLEDMKREVKESGASSVIVHGPFTELCPGSIDHRAIKLAMDRLNEAYGVCQSLGVKRMVVHSGYMPLIYFKEWHLEKSIEFWKKFMCDKEWDFRIFIENVFEDEPYMLKKLIQGIEDSRVSLCLDIGHANTMTKGNLDICQWIETLGRDIGHVHLHNNDGIKDLHHPLNCGIMDIDKVLDSVNMHCGEDVTFTIESRECRESAIWLLAQ